MIESTSTFAARSTIALATLIGGGSLTLLGVFLFLGPFGFVEFRR